jgi:hypothetical protein
MEDGRGRDEIVLRKEDERMWATTRSRYDLGDMKSVNGG